MAPQKSSPRHLAFKLLFAVWAMKLAAVSGQSQPIAVTTPQDLISAMRNGTQYIQVAAHLDFKSFEPIAPADQPLLPPIDDVVSVIWGQCTAAAQTSSAPYADELPQGPCVIDAAGRGRLFAIKGAKAQLWLQDLVLVGSTTEFVPQDAVWEDVPQSSYRSGGAIGAFNGASLYLERVWAMSSFSAANGGGVAHIGGTSTTVANLTDVHLVDNSADVDGGGAYFYASNSVIQDVEIRDNKATQDGYALFFGTNSSSYITRIAPTRNTDAFGTLPQKKPQIMLELTPPPSKNGTNTTNGTYSQRIFTDLPLWGNGNQYVSGSFNATATTSPAATQYLQSLFKPDSSLADILKARIMINSPPVPISPAAAPAAGSQKKGLFAAKWRVAVIATCLSVLFCAMICICYFCYRIQRLNYERHYSFSTKMLQYDAEMAANSADVAVPMASRTPRNGLGLDTPFGNDSDSSVKLTVFSSISEPRSVKTSTPDSQSRAPPPAPRPGGGLQVQELELTDYSGKLRIPERPLAVSSGGLTASSLPPTPLAPRAHSGPLSALSPVLARSVPMTQLTPPVIRSPAASDAGNSANLSDAADKAKDEGKAAPAPEPAAAPSADKPAPADVPPQEMVSEKLADLLHLDELEPDPPRATPQNSSPSTTSLSLPSPSSTSYSTAEMDDDADSGPLRANGTDSMRGNPLYLREDSPGSSGVGASPPPGSDAMDGSRATMPRSISPPYDKHVKALKAEAFDAMPSSCSEYLVDKSEFRPHVLHGTRRMMDGPAIGTVPAGASLANGHALQPGAMEGSARGASSTGDPETAGQRQLKYARRGILDRRKPEPAAVEDGPLAEDEGERPISATKSPFSNPGGGWKRNSPFSRKTPGAQPGKLSGRSSRKKAQKRMMLNRAETPSASLFAISEEAEIRYTNGGVLYEVPAHEASMMLLKSMSSTSDLEAHLEEAEEEFDEQFSDSFSDSNEAENSSSVDSKDMDIEEDDEVEEEKNGHSGEVKSGQLGSDAPSDNQTFFYSPTKSDVYVDTTTSGNPFA